jgi:hypothetical protein
VKISQAKSVKYSSSLADVEFREDKTIIITELEQHSKLVNDLFEFRFKCLDWNAFVINATSVLADKVFEDAIEWFGRKIAAIQKWGNARYENVFNFWMLLREILETFVLPHMNSFYLYQLVELCHKFYCFGKKRTIFIHPPEFYLGEKLDQKADSWYFGSLYLNCENPERVSDLKDYSNEFESLLKSLK